jgi:hypothetical protein
MYLPSVAEVVYSATHQSTPNVYYAKEMRYPVSGGMPLFLAVRLSQSEFSLTRKLL